MLILLNDLAELAEKVLELCVLLEGGDVVETFREFVWTLTHERDRRNILGRGRPEIAIGEDQLCFLIERNQKSEIVLKIGTFQESKITNKM